MISELAKWFYKRNPSLASAIIGWGTLEYAQMLVIALFLVTLVSEVSFYAQFVEWWVLLFLFNFEKSLKQIVVVSLEPQNLRVRISNKLKKKSEKKLEVGHKYFPIAAGVLNVNYCICILASESFGERLGWTIHFFVVFEFCFLVRTEIKKLIKK